MSAAAMTTPAMTTPRTGVLRRLLVIAGWVAAAVIAVSTVASGLPSGSGQAAPPSLTVLALALWLVALRPGVTDTRLLTTCLVGTGIAGAVLDLLHPSGPGYILAFMAVAAIGVRLPRRAAFAAGAVVVLTAGAADAYTSARNSCRASSSRPDDPLECSSPTRLSANRGRWRRNPVWRSSARRRRP